MLPGGDMIAAIERACSRPGEPPASVREATTKISGVLWDGPDRLYFSGQGDSGGVVGVATQDAAAWKVASWCVEGPDPGPAMVPLVIAQVLMPDDPQSASHYHFAGCPCLAACAGILLRQQSRTTVSVGVDETSADELVSAELVVRWASDQMRADLVVLGGATQVGLVAALAKVRPEGDCVLVPPLAETTVALDTYRTIHLPRVELSGWCDDLIGAHLAGEAGRVALGLLTAVEADTL
jgi:hypothetical protein